FCMGGTTHAMMHPWISFMLISLISKSERSIRPYSSVVRERDDVIRQCSTSSSPSKMPRTVSGFPTSMTRRIERIERREETKIRDPSDAADVLHRCAREDTSHCLSAHAARRHDRFLLQYRRYLWQADVRVDRA